jgi:hypothetical protein
MSSFVDLHSSSAIIRIIKSRSMGWTCSMHKETRIAHRILEGNTEGEKPQGHLDEGGRIILKWILGRIVCRGLNLPD